MGNWQVVASPQSPPRLRGPKLHTIKPHERQIFNQYMHRTQLRPLPPGLKKVRLWKMYRMPNGALIHGSHIDDSRLARASYYARVEVEDEYSFCFAEIKYFFTRLMRNDNRDDIQNTSDEEKSDKTDYAKTDSDPRTFAVIRRIAHIEEGRLIYKDGYRHTQVISVENIKEQVGLITSGKRRYFISISGATWDMTNLTCDNESVTTDHDFDATHAVWKTLKGHPNGFEDFKMIEEEWEAEDAEAYD